MGLSSRFKLTECHHGPHSREEQGTRDEDKLKITVFNSNKTRQGRVVQDKNKTGKARQGGQNTGSKQIDADKN